ncbi:hypothetical protein HXX76_013511 [Chlamydomonas incerta]|uniref:Glycoside hydrolase family 42 N-terminal domain-containing protein n=1 Tax=Chlamydomonas incerta TaxID=51695 RepID=A0A835VU69_CHLIN|nr:hypothetical protein HXX76_013511 [Chlamydomonas incerta]|eukprot:KAG2425669.1 hypothetical protein HXX76_013511 [Chlamydomonas incerta]
MRLLRPTASGRTREGPAFFNFRRLCALAAVAVSCLALTFALNKSSSTSQSKSVAPRRSLLAQLTSHRLQPLRAVRQKTVDDTFATIFHSELIDLFGLHKGGPEPVDKLLHTLQQLEGARIRTVMFSVSWAWLEPAAGRLRWDYLEALVGTACGRTQLKVALIVDLMRAPGWLFAVHPGAAVLDAGGRNYSHLSWFHGPANQMARDSLRQVVEGLAAEYGGCLSGVQPVYNNEYEAKYTQEFDSYQDYNAAALGAYRDRLRGRLGGDLGRLNARWETHFGSWEQVAPPKLFAGAVMGPDDSARFWDWQQFRVQHGASIFNDACAVVKAAGVRCFHHFPEFFSVLDAVYGAAMFRHIAASPYTDFLIMDSNFRTSTGAVMDPRKLRLYISAAHAYGKPTYFEAAVERFADMKLLQAGYRHALLAGAAHMGLTNWLGRIDVTAPELAAAMHVEAAPAPAGGGAAAAAATAAAAAAAAAATAGSDCEASEVVGVFIHLDSCGAWHGLQWKSPTSKDPLHDFVDKLAERLIPATTAPAAAASGGDAAAAAATCGTDVAVFVDLDRFAEAVAAGRLSRAVFVEPLVLAGGAEADGYVAAKAALKAAEAAGLPVEMLRLPTGGARGLGITILSDLS